MQVNKAKLEKAFIRSKEGFHIHPIHRANKRSVFHLGLQNKPRHCQFSFYLINHIYTWTSKVWNWPSASGFKYRNVTSIMWSYYMPIFLPLLIPHKKHKRVTGVGRLVALPTRTLNEKEFSTCPELLPTSDSGWN